MPPPTQRWICPAATANVRMVSASSRSPFGWIRPSAPIEAPRPTGSSAAIRSSAAIFGQPVTEPPGSTASSSSVSVTSSRSSPSTVATRCDTPASWCSASSSGQRTLPGTQTRDRSFRSRSTIITCSAASFADSTGTPAGRVPLIGDVRTIRPRRESSSSGDAETIVQPVARERQRLERPQRRERVREPGRIAVEVGAEVLHEVDLVDVALGDRRAHRLDRRRVLRLRPAPAPVPDREAPRRRAGAHRRARSSTRPPAAGTAPAAAGRRPAAASRSRGSRRRRARTRRRARRTPPPRARARGRRATPARRSTADGPRGEAQPVEPELEVVDRDALVRRMDELRRHLGRHRARGKNPYATVPNASRSQWLSVNPAQQIGTARAPGSISATNASTASQSGVSSAERVPPSASSQSMS